MTTKDVGLSHLAQLWKPEAMMPIDQKLADVADQIGLINETLYGGETDDRYNGININTSADKMHLRHQVGEVQQNITLALQAQANLLGFRRIELIKARKELQDTLQLLLEMRRNGVDWVKTDLRANSRVQGLDDGGLEAEVSPKNEYDLLNGPTVH